MMLSKTKNIMMIEGGNRFGWIHLVSDRYRYIKVEGPQKKNVTELSERMSNLRLTLLHETHILKLTENNELHYGTVSPSTVHFFGTGKE